MVMANDINNEETDNVSFVSYCATQCLFYKSILIFIL